MNYIMTFHHLKVLKYFDKRNLIYQNLNNSVHTYLREKIQVTQLQIIFTQGPDE